MKLNLERLKGKIIAIDGPAGSGKSTTARLLAARLGYRFLDTGAMYRALTHFALTHDISPSDGDKLGLLAHSLEIKFKTAEDVNHVYINGEDVTEEIRTAEVTKHVSEVSAFKKVRLAMVEKQQELGREGSIVAEGRDTTTVVFFNADLKVYLDASLKERARRRLLELVRKGVNTTMEEQEADIIRRDGLDSGRDHSPLMKSRDAVLVDTTEMSIEEQVDRIVALLKARSPAR